MQGFRSTIRIAKFGPADDSSKVRCESAARSARAFYDDGKKYVRLFGCSDNSKNRQIFHLNQYILSPEERVSFKVIKKFDEWSVGDAERACLEAMEGSGPV